MNSYLIMEPPPLEITSEILFGIEESRLPTNSESAISSSHIVDYLLFLQYHLNNLNAKAKFKCVFLTLIRKILLDKSFNSYRARRL